MSLTDAGPGIAMAAVLCVTVATGACAERAGQQPVSESVIETIKSAGAAGRHVDVRAMGDAGQRWRAGWL